MNFKKEINRWNILKFNVDFTSCRKTDSMLFLMLIPMGFPSGGIDNFAIGIFGKLIATCVIYSKISRWPSRLAPNSLNNSTHIYFRLNIFYIHFWFDIIFHSLSISKGNTTDFVHKINRIFSLFLAAKINKMISISDKFFE